MKYPVITISREFGAGGRSIAKRLSEELGIPYYDKDIVARAAEKSGYTKEEIEREGEDISRASHMLGGFLSFGAAAGYNNQYDEIFRAQAKAILEFAQEPCILVGRCADSILREAGIDCFNVFLYADLEHRVHRIEERDHEQGAKVRKMVDKRDQQRKEYYKVYTGSELGDYHNYDISLDTGVIGYDQCVEIIAGIVRRRIQQ
ncbi:MAG: cytidylate kinase-like family protein [Lachnospiraceae bacterium]|nr:cytidylate kinase-like family protein [Lachnospiraceae bacterium]MBQ9644435.1 cytidylate kinase-like family protein [Lachnospiraceae bacterium]